MSRNFEEWLAKFEDSIASWVYYTDFNKVYSHVNKIKNELNLLNGLIGSKNIEEDFKNLIDEYPNVLKTIPILIAKKMKGIYCNHLKFVNTNENYINVSLNCIFSVKMVNIINMLHYYYERKTEI